MEKNDKAMNMATIKFVIFIINSGIFFLTVGPTDIMNLSNYLQILTTVILAFGIIGIAILLYGLMFLGVVIPEKICDLIATIGLIIASVLIILEPILVQFLKP